MCSRAVTLSIREATAADNEALLELERSSPLDLGDAEVILDNWVRNGPHKWSGYQYWDNTEHMKQSAGKGLLGGCCYAERGGNAGRELCRP